MHRVDKVDIFFSNFAILPAQKQTTGFFLCFHVLSGEFYERWNFFCE